MHHVWLAVAVVGLLGVGCGDEPAAGPLGFEIGATSQALLEDIAAVQIQLHPGDVDCLALLVSGPGLDAVYEVNLLLADGVVEATSTLYDVVEDQYTVDAWGFNDGGNIQGYACLEQPISVVRGQRTTVNLVMAQINGG